MQPLIPVFTTAIAVIFLIEGFAILKVIGILLAVAGAIVMIGFSGFDNHDHIVGMLFFVGNCVCVAVYLIAQKPLLQVYPPISLTGWIYTIGSVFMGLTLLIYYLVWNPPNLWVIHSNIWGPLAYSVILATILAYFLISWANKHMPSSVVSSFWTLQPLSSALLSWIFIGETINLREVIGAILILSGLGAVLYQKWKEESAQSTVTEDIELKPMMDEVLTNDTKGEE